MFQRNYAQLMEEEQRPDRPASTNVPTVNKKAFIFHNDLPSITLIANKSPIYPFHESFKIQQKVN